MHDLTHRHQKTTRITIIGAICNIFLAIIKCVAGWLGNSHALFADGIHSLADLFADGIVLLASKFGTQQADAEHPYGHQRIETAATIIVAAFLLLAGIGILLNGADHILNPNQNNYIHPYVLWIALLALIINEVIYWITMKIARQLHSDMLKAHAWHRRSDAAASLIVLLGIGGAMLGMPYLDGVAAIIIGLFILKMAWNMGRSSFDELIDRGVHPLEQDEIRKTILAVPGVEAVHQLRTRLMGGRIFADAHVIVNHLLSVSEGHYIGDHVYISLQKKFPNLDDITIHIDSEDDEMEHMTSTQPTRQDILQTLSTLDLPFANQMQLKNIHYQAKDFTLEILLPLSVLANESAETLQSQYQTKIQFALPSAIIKLFFTGNEKN